jgi:microcin C transport system substrate-binding protein
MTKNKMNFYIMCKVNKVSVISIVAALSLFITVDILASQDPIKSHAIAIHGEPKYPADFTRFDYTSAKAKKGGGLRLAGKGTFDSLNEYIAKGNPADNLALLYDTLMVASADEPFTQYGLLAHKIEYPEDRSWVIFHLRPEAYFRDGHPVDAEDVVFSFNLLLEKGSPIYQFYYQDVIDVVALDAFRVKFTFGDTNTRELPLILGELPVLPKHFWEGKEFDKSSLEIPLGSGPYRVKSVDAGRNITYERNYNYWGQDLPVNNGLYNFDIISVDYYRDNNIAIEAIKANEYDFRWENSSKFWATAYDIPAIKNKQLIKKDIKHSANKGMQAFVYNLRKPLFQDVVLRKAISYAFDFEWSNEMLFYNVYSRAYSFHSNSELAATGLPSKDELALLTPYKDQLPESVFTQPYELPKSDGSGHNRPNLRNAKAMLDNAGYVVKKNQLYNAEGKKVNFEILLVSPGFERIVNPFIRSLKKLGIYVNVRLIDRSQYINRKRSFEFDMIVHSFAQSESPGAEQQNFWGSRSAKLEGSGNLAGIANPVIDHLIEYVANAHSRKELVTATRALDRVLLHNYYAIPQWYTSSSRIVYWDKFNFPNTSPVYDKYYTRAIYSWWYSPEKSAKLNAQ